jgi:hypothetical protein
VNAHMMDHRLDRDDFTCRACGQDYPCVQGRERLLKLYRGRLSELGEYLGRLYVDMHGKVRDQPAELFWRLLAWLPVEEKQT